MDKVDFYTDIKDLDVDISLLKSDLKENKVSGTPVLLAENEHGVVALFYEKDNGVSFYTWAAPVGVSSEFHAVTLDSAVSKAECFGMFVSPTGIIKAEEGHYGQKEIDQHKLGIDYKVDPFPREKKAKKSEKMKEAAKSHREFLNDICDSACNMIGNEDALFFTQKDKNTFLLKGILLDELDDGTFTPQDMWEVVGHNRGMAKDFKAVDWSYSQLTLKVEDK